MAGPVVRGPQAMLSKWWLKYQPMHGRVTRHLSPYEQKPVRSLIATMPEKTIRKVRENAPVLLPAALLCVGTIQWGLKLNDEDHRKHWS